MALRTARSFGRWKRFSRSAFKEEYFIRRVYPRMSEARADAAKRIATIMVPWKRIFSRPRRAYLVVFISEPNALPRLASERWRRTPATRSTESVI